MLEQIFEQFLGYVHTYIPGWLITTAKVIFYFILAVFIIQIVRLIVRLVLRFLAGILSICWWIVKEILPYALGIGVVSYLGQYVWRRFSVGQHLAAFHIDVHSIWGWLHEHGIVTYTGYALLLLVGGFIVCRFLYYFFRFHWKDYLTEGLGSSSSGVSRTVRSSRSYGNDDRYSSSSDDEEKRQRAWEERERAWEEERERAQKEEEMEERRLHHEKIEDARREKEWETAMYNLYHEEDSARRATEAAEREERLRESSW